MSTPFPFVNTLGFFFIGGETMNFSFILSRTTYSLNTIAILLPLKFLAPFTGSLFTTTGGSLSLGPPDGELIFAHAPKIAMRAEIRKRRSIILLYINSSGYL